MPNASLTGDICVPALTSPPRSCDKTAGMRKGQAAAGPYENAAASTQTSRSPASKPAAVRRQKAMSTDNGIDALDLVAASTAVLAAAAVILRRMPAAYMVWAPT